MTDKYERFVKAIADLVGTEKPMQFAGGKCDLNSKWDERGFASKQMKERLNKGTLDLGRKEFNQLLLIMGAEPVSDWFFRTIIASPGTESSPAIAGLEEFEKSVGRFRVKCALKFGNFKYAFRYFAGIGTPHSTLELGLQRDPEDTWNELNRSEESLKGEIIGRHPPALSLYDIPMDQRHYVSELNRPKEGKGDYERAMEVLRKAKFNSALYLTSDFIDVYVATSMRTPTQFRDVAKKIKKVFEQTKLAELKNVRYFDPTLSDGSGDNGSGRLSKGLIEALMLKRCKVTLYLAQESDSLGKDSELATTLAQGKDVIVFVPRIGDSRNNELDEILRKGDSSAIDELDYLRTIALKFVRKRENDKFDFEAIAKKIFEIADPQSLLSEISKMVEMEQVFYDQRAELLLNKHPLGLQVNLQTGVANGIIVVRNEEEAADAIYRSLTNSHKYALVESQEGTSEGEWRLIETEHKSTVRFVTKDKFMTKAFWANYLDLKRHE